MLLFPLNGKVVLLQPCPFCSYQPYSLYMNFLDGLSEGDIAADDSAWEILQRLVDLHPRGDRRGYGFPLPRQEYKLIEGLLDKLKDLNKVDPLPERPKPKNYMNLLPESSGDLEIDLLADLANIYGYKPAIAIIQTKGLDAINKLIIRHNEINKPREDRAQEKMAEDLSHWASDDPTFFTDLGL